MIGSTLGYLTLGLFTDVIAKGRNLYTVLACFILSQFIFIFGFTITENFVADEHINKAAVTGSFGFVNGMNTVL